MSKPLISIIVPVYNTRTMIPNMIASLLEQSYENIEIILVDDGSTDGSGILCDEYASIHDNVHVYHKENGGQSSARNLGIKKSKGVLIGFVDSDDYVGNQMYAYLYELLLEYNADVASIKIQPTYSISCIAQQPKEKIVVKDGIDILRYYMEVTTKSDGYSVCRCLFKRSIVCDHEFREGFRYEDIDYKFVALSKANRFVDSNQIFYFYLQTENSTSFAPLKKRDEELSVASEVLYKLCVQTGDDLLIRYAEIKKARTPLSLLMRAAYVGFDLKDYPLETQGQLIKQLTIELRKGMGILLSSPIPITRKLSALLLSVSFNCMSLPIKIYKKLRK